jgi:hypothetical protein
MAAAESAVAHDALGLALALLEGALDLAAGHSCLALLLACLLACLDRTGLA